jgi:hypothetical protein
MFCGISVCYLYIFILIKPTSFVIYSFFHRIAFYKIAMIRALSRTILFCPGILGALFIIAYHVIYRYSMTKSHNFPIYL